MSAGETAAAVVAAVAATLRTVATWNEDRPTLHEMADAVEQGWDGWGQACGSSAGSRGGRGRVLVLRPRRQASPC
ncbi:hypothetical protein [Microbispora triticiradicis]|uniref:Uncharacterized protein n=2 Tax=Microbispora TaxID=2005 RepID=A0ABY3LVC8_9ACTN|nr:MULTISPECIES: hypothetical protein [Microbispora]TLP52416.1 hypothetical protein FED44_32435 [Microbispora fusca]TYB55417.1 hypothetical protein FXF59_21170 [Microbispora tritici]